MTGVLCQAAADGDIDYLKMLVDNGLDPNAADYDSRTALHLAASNNRLDVIKYLCRIPHIHVNAVDRTGEMGAVRIEFLDVCVPSKITFLSGE